MTATRPQPRPGILNIAAYVPGRSKAPGVARVYKMSANETPLGPSPRAIAAYHEAAATMHDYPDGSSTALRVAIGKLLKRMKNIRYSRGKDSVIRDPHFFAWGPREVYITFDRIHA